MLHVYQFRHSGWSGDCIAGHPQHVSPNTLALLKRIHRRLFRLNDEIAAIDEEIAGVTAELEYHRSIDADARRDAEVGNYIDREEAGLTAADVLRFERLLDHLATRRSALIDKREKLVARLPE